MNKPELLSPAGNIEAFYAALEAGADAVYLGLNNFNARERADNFHYKQLPVIIEEAHRNDTKVFITLNTVLKNSEIPEFIDTLAFLNRAKPDAIIIQDWGAYFLVKNYFRKLNLHASTQMAIHNSDGAIYTQRKGFDRVIPARELTMEEMQAMVDKSKLGIEAFIHGALCYSYSGMCHFSSYLGGHGANRGLCTQVCRRDFKTKKGNAPIFSLKDNQQAAQIPDLINAGVESMKIEGRLKSSDYVYRVTKAYRDLIDEKITVEQAEEILSLDAGREKTGYFLSGYIKDAITSKANTGLPLGQVVFKENNTITVSSNQTFDSPIRLRIKDRNTGNQQNLKVRDYTQEDNQITFDSDLEFNLGDEVFLASVQEKKFPQKFPEYDQRIPKFKAFNKGKIIKELWFKDAKVNYTLFVRIDNTEWLKKIYFDTVDAVIFSFSEHEWNELKMNSGLIQKFKHKIWFELPRYISEKKLSFYKSFVDIAVKKGFKKFMLSHITQKEILPKDAIFGLNENAYVYNDAAIHQFRNEGAKLVTYPVENDKENLYNYSYKAGIIPLYFYPRLFMSRMPISVKEEETIIDDIGKKYKKFSKDGMTIITPEVPVSLTQYAEKFKKHGFGRFLIDLSFEKPSSNKFNTITKRYFQSVQIQPSTNFNYSRDLK
ncbi:MAG: peptidase U32 family protein [Bacteroidota bacterium]|nr:peptidase U32 family protein [Bacteroidota bacterium]